MADEQTPQSDLIEDALRKAERQLEERLAAFQLTALGEPSRPEHEDPDVAVLRPTGARDANAPSVQASGTSSLETAWRETEGDDIRFEPVLADVFSPSAEPTPQAPQAPLAPPVEARSDDASFASPSSISDLVANWDIEQQADTTSPAAAESGSWDRPEPVHAAWTSSDTAYEPAPPRRATVMPNVPSEDEMQFWAQTRTALRNLQQVTDVMPGQVVGGVSDEVERIIRGELKASSEALRAVQQQLGTDLPKLAERVESSIEQHLAGPTASVRQLREELPLETDRTVHETRSGIREDLDHAASAIHGAVQQDVAQLEQSIASNVTRMTQGLTDSVQRVERDVEGVSESVVRFERGVHGEFDRVEAQLRSSIERVEQNLRDELVAPSATVRKLDEELPARFDRVERSVLDQVQATQRDLSSVLTGLVDANRASLDRIAAVASTLDDDRARRADDLDIVVDTMTTGWEGLAGAVKALYEQGKDIGSRIDQIEQRLSQLRDLEGTVEKTMQELRGHVKDLSPAPVVVTVSHPEAQVSNTSRGGWLPSDQLKG